MPRAEVAPGLYRTVTGTEALALGLVAGAQAAALERIVMAGYPITPASPILHALANMKEFGVVTFQAEDEIAAVCAAIGASFAGALGITSSSGPGIALKTEALGLAVMTELPLIVINSQRAGPSTGMPTKTEQSDLLQAIWGRNGDTPMPVLAAATPAECFEVAYEAVRLATRYMTPVFVLSDGYLANAAEPWRIPDINAMPKFPVTVPHQSRGVPPLRPRPEDAGPGLGVAGDPRPGAPHRRHREGLTTRVTSPTIRTITSG